MNAQTYTCHTATVKKAVKALVGENCDYDRFIIASDSIPGTLRVSAYKVITESWEKPRKRARGQRTTVTIPGGSIRRKLQFCGEAVDTYQLPNGSVVVFDKDLNGREFENWFKAFRGLVWAFAMESEAIPMSLSGKVGKPYFCRNHFSGESKWT